MSKQKQFTADEMREISYAFEPRGVVARIDNGNGEREIFARDIVAMLRRAADELEREKGYEYTVIAKKHDGEVFIDTEHFGTLESAKKNAEDSFYDVLRYERREVGKWEEVE